MRKKSVLLPILLLVNLLVASISFENAAAQTNEAMTVKTDKTLYPFEWPIMITGKIAVDRLVKGQDATLIIVKPDNTEYLRESVEVSEDGSFAFEVIIPDGQPDGNYHLLASYNELSAETTFRVTTVVVDSFPIDDQCFTQVCTYDLLIGNQSYPIDYVMAGRITDIAINKEKSSLMLTINSSESWRLQIALPREVIEAVNPQGSDVEFVAFTDGNKAESFDVMANATLRTLAIDYQNGTKNIEIMGTWVVPEFSSVSMLVFGIAAFASVALGRRALHGSQRRG